MPSCSLTWYLHTMIAAEPLAATRCDRHGAVAPSIESANAGQPRFTVFVPVCPIRRRNATAVNKIQSMVSARVRLCTRPLPRLLVIGLLVSGLACRRTETRGDSPNTTATVPPDAPLSAKALSDASSKWRLSRVVSPEQLDTAIDNIMSVEPAPIHLSLNDSGTRLAYVRGTSTGRAAFILDLDSLEIHRLPISGEVSKVYGWSPGGTWLSLSESPRQNLQEEHLLIYDTGDSTIQRLTSATNITENAFAWLGDDRYYFTAKGLNKSSTTDRYVGNWASKTRHAVNTFLDEFVQTSKNVGAYGYEGNIHACSIDSTETPVVTDISRFSEGFDRFVGRWLRYNHRTNTYLFSSTPKGSNWRYLYKYSPTHNQLTRLTDEDTYSSQWLQDGKGYAYIGNRDNHFYLAVRPELVSGNIDLFIHGSVASFIVDPSRNTIYAVASTGVEPQGIWKYDISSHIMSSVMPGSTNQYVIDHLVEPDERKAVAPDGTRTTFFVYPPASGAKSAVRDPAALKRHPLFINMFVTSDQAKNVWNPHSQLLSILGWYAIDANYRGCDGYGKAYSDMRKDISGAASDVMAIYREVIGYPDVDPGAITLGGRSDAAAIVTKLLTTSPQLWNDVLLNHPDGSLVYQGLQPNGLPPIMAISGDQDRHLPAVSAFMSWAKKTRVRAELIVQTDTGHVSWDLDQDKKFERRWLHWTDIE